MNANNDAVIDGYARGLFEVARAEGTLDGVEDRLFRFARSYESSEELRSTRSATSRSARQAAGDRRGSPRRQGDADDDAARLVVVGSGHSRDLPAIIDRMVSAPPAPGRSVAEVRSPVRPDPRPGGAPHGRAGERHEQERRPQGDRRSLRDRRPRLHRRRHRSSTAPSHAPRPAEIASLIWPAARTPPDIAGPKTPSATAGRQAPLENHG